MTGQVEEFIDEQTQFLLRACSGARLDLLRQAVETVDDQHGLCCGGFDELDLLWRVLAVTISFGDEQCAHRLLLKQQGPPQFMLWCLICLDPEYLPPAVL